MRPAAVSAAVSHVAVSSEGCVGKASAALPAPRAPARGQLRAAAGAAAAAASAAARRMLRALRRGARRARAQRQARPAAAQQDAFRGQSQAAVKSRP
jgi:hypothetical protein